MGPTLSRNEDGQHLKLRIKTAAILIAATLSLVIILHEVYSTALTGSYDQLERNQVNQTVIQIQGAMQDQFNVLNSKLSRWAQWNDTYDFMESTSTAYVYISSNLLRNGNQMPPAMGAFGVNYVLYINSSGTIVYGIGYNLVNLTVEHIPTDFLNLVLGNPQIWKFQSTESNFSGIVMIPEGPLLVVSQPILTSEATGPIHGALIFARYIDSQFIGQLSTTLNLPLTIIPYTNWQSITENSSAFIPPFTYIHVVNADAITGYYLANDFTGHPVFLIGATLQRTIHEEGLATISYLDIAVWTAGLSFVLITLVVMETTVLRRIHNLVSDVVKIGSHYDVEAKVSVQGNDEIAMLGGSINGMLSEIGRKSEQLQKSERFSAIGELATMVAHDLRNPLQSILNATYYFERRPTMSAKDREILATVEDGVRYSNKIVSDLLDYSRNFRLQPGETDPHLLIKQTLSMVTVPENIVVQDETSDRPKLNVDIDLMRRSFVNIVNNALDAMPKGGSLTIRSADRNDGSVVFTFSDTGTGMSEEAKEKAFTPLYTTKAKGMGFGLSICKRIIEAHGGKISVDSAPGKGTTFTVSLPSDYDHSDRNVENQP
jgi:signal transduction histidine kinase